MTIPNKILALANYIPAVRHPDRDYSSSFCHFTRKVEEYASFVNMRKKSPANVANVRREATGSRFWSGDDMYLKVESPEDNIRG